MDELIQDFLVETKESLDVLDTEIVKLESDSTDKKVLDNIFRLLHTIKGTCGFLGLGRLEKIAHLGESVLDMIRSGTLQGGEEIISTILEVIDLIKDIIDEIENTGVEPTGDDSALISKLEVIISGKPITNEPNTPTTSESNIESERELTELEMCEALFADDPPISNNTQVSDVTNDNIQIGEDLQKNTNEEINTPQQAEKLKPQDEKSKIDKVKTNQTIRINIDTVESLMQDVSELVLTRNQLLQIFRNNDDPNQVMAIQRLNYITSELQERVMKTRMQPVGNSWNQFPRMIRELSKDLNKKIELVQKGQDTELDRQLLESIKDPLTHMIRNSADHGIEMPEDRLNAGKPEKGKITLNAYHQGGHIVIEISDDGKGISSEKIKEKIVKNGLATYQELSSMTSHQVQQYIFKAGFSTAEKITSVSGRGVGMDVVKTNIEKINGSIELDSVEGEGSSFKIKIPLTLAIMPILIVKSGECQYGIPQINIIEIVKTSKMSEHRIEYINNKPLLKIRNTLLSLVKLNSVLNEANEEIENSVNYIVVCELNNVQFGIIVDGIFDTEEIVVKPLSTMLQKIEVYSGCTILGDGSVIMILDPNGLTKNLSHEEILDSSNNIKNNGNGDSEYTGANLILVKSEDGSRKAIPLEVVARLEELDMLNVEYVEGTPVVQYLNKLMYLEHIDGKKVPAEGFHEVIVINDNNNYVGLLVDEITDIVEHDMQYVSSNIQDDNFGTIILDGITTKLVNVAHYYNKYFGKQITQNNNDDCVPICSSKEILLIDDSPFFRKFIPPVLEKEGYRVTTIENAFKALKLLESGKRFATIITDMNMPEMTGEEFAFNCSNDNRFSNIPIVALSANVRENIAEDPFSVGFWAHVSKTNYKNIVAVVNQLIAENRDLA